MRTQHVGSICCGEKELPDNEKEGLLMMPYNYDCKLTFMPSDSRGIASDT